MVPEWAEEVSSSMMEKLAVPNNLTTAILDLSKIESYSTFFAEWVVKGEDLLLHLFPRSGKEDRWVDGRYIPRCRKCDRELEPQNVGKPCQCGSTALVYIPGRVEGRSDLSFPENMLDIIKDAVDVVWMGSFAAEELEELGAYVVQIHEGWNGDEERAFGLIEGLLDKVDEGLEGCRSSD